MIPSGVLLDRFELLYPDNDILKDLRRAYIDKDLSSIFRLLSDRVPAEDIDELRKAVIEQNLHSIFRLLSDRVPAEDIDELRKAVIEQNLHSIFRLADDEDLRKLILEDNTWKLWPVLERYTDTQFIAAFKNFFVNEIIIDTDCFSRGQLLSKKWLVEELERVVEYIGTVFLCAGWYGTLATLLFESKIKIDKIRSFDIDPSCVDIAKTFNRQWVMNDWGFQAITCDIMDIDYDEHTWQLWSNTKNRMSNPITDSPDTIINTSCEHIAEFTEWYNKIPKDKLVILQSNDFFEVDEHVNCSETLNDFSESCPMTTTLYQGELVLDDYTRFMKIGIK